MTEIGIACSHSIRASPFAVTTTSPSDFDSTLFRSLSREGEIRQIKIRLKAESKSLGEVVVTAKGEARILREQAMPISVISMNQLSGTVNSIVDVLNKTVGVTLRSSGGVGGATRLSVRGLEGKRIGFFIEETPLNDNTDFIDINDIPIDMIDRIEVYKGVVPAKFGGSTMRSGAVFRQEKEHTVRGAPQEADSRCCDRLHCAFAYNRYTLLVYHLFLYLYLLDG